MVDRIWKPVSVPDLSSNAISATNTTISSLNSFNNTMSNLIGEAQKKNSDRAALKLTEQLNKNPNLSIKDFIADNPDITVQGLNSAISLTASKDALQKARELYDSQVKGAQSKAKLLEQYNLANGNTGVANVYGSSYNDAKDPEHVFVLKTDSQADKQLQNAKLAYQLAQLNDLQSKQSQLAYAAHIASGGGTAQDAGLEENKKSFEKQSGVVVTPVIQLGATQLLGGNYGTPATVEGSTQRIVKNAGTAVAPDPNIPAVSNVSTSGSGTPTKAAPSMGENIQNIMGAFDIETPTSSSQNNQTPPPTAQNASQDQATFAQALQEVQSNTSNLASSLADSSQIQVFDPTGLSASLGSQVPAAISNSPNQTISLNNTSNLASSLTSNLSSGLTLSPSSGLTLNPSSGLTSNSSSSQNTVDPADTVSNIVNSFVAGNPPEYLKKQAKKEELEKKANERIDYYTSITPFSNASSAGEMLSYFRNSVENDPVIQEYTDVIQNQYPTSSTPVNTSKLTDRERLDFYHNSLQSTKDYLQGALASESTIAKFASANGIPYSTPEEKAAVKESLNAELSKVNKAYNDLDSYRSNVIFWEGVENRRQQYNIPHPSSMNNLVSVLGVDSNQLAFYAKSPDATELGIMYNGMNDMIQDQINSYKNSNTVLELVRTTKNSGALNTPQALVTAKVPGTDMTLSELWKSQGFEDDDVNSVAADITDFVSKYPTFKNKDLLAKLCLSAVKREDGLVYGTNLVFDEDLAQAYIKEARDIMENPALASRANARIRSLETAQQQLTANYNIIKEQLQQASAADISEKSLPNTPANMYTRISLRNAKYKNLSLVKAGLQAMSEIELGFQHSLRDD